MEGVFRNPTLYPKALTSSESDPSFKWHDYAHSPRSSQVFCISAFGTLRNLAVGNRVLANLLYEAFPVIATKGTIAAALDLHGRLGPAKGILAGKRVVQRM